MAVTPILETDTMNQGRIKINQILEQSNSSIQTVEGYNQVLQQGITEAKKIATDAGAEAVQIATDATASIEATANQANVNSRTAINTANNAVSTANQNKQEFDQLRNDFDYLVAEAGDSNPEIVQARTDTMGVKQTTLANRLTVDFADRMTKADGIELFSGQTNVKKMMDFTGKTAGNTATNPHQAYSDFTAKALKKPSDSWNEVAQTDYNKLASRDDSGVSTGSSASGVIPQQLYKLNAVEAVKSLAPQLFEGLSAEESVQFVKNNFVSLVLTLRGKASSPNNKNLKVSTYLESTDSWTTQGQESATEYTDLTVQINDANFIDSNGFVYVISYSDMTNGVTASSIDVDYVGVAVEVSINALDILDKGGFAKDSEVAGKSEFDEHISDTQNPHSVTKAQVGLGNVPNYASATDADALAGTASNKLITPANMNAFYLSKTQKRRQRWDGGLNWIAHRGSNSDFAENSIPAFLAAKRHWGIETDIQVTADGQWVVMHDETVDRTTNGTGAVASKTLAQFRALRFDTGNNLGCLTDAEKTPPTFEEYLLICKQLNKVPVVEIKSYDYTDTHYDLLKETLNRFGYDESNCVLASFDYAVLTKIRALYPNMELHYFVNSVSTEAINQAIALGIPAALSASYGGSGVDEASVSLTHAAGLKFGVWTVPDASFDAMIKIGVDYITTNSKSGNLRWAQLTFENGFNQEAKAAFVEEVGSDLIYLSFSLNGGNNTRSTVMFTLPDWAIPLYNQWLRCGIRISSGTSDASYDIQGRLIGGKPGAATVSYGWENRTTWASSDALFSKY